MKVLLIQPPFSDFYRTSFREYPLGLLYIAASLRKKNLNTFILDAANRKKTQKLTLPEKLKYLENYYTKDNKLFLDYKYFGLSQKTIIEEVLKTKPHYIGISSLFTPYANEVLNTANNIKNSYPNVKIVIGGHHASSSPDTFFASSSVDAVIRGEGEEALPDMLQKSKKLTGTSDKSYRIENLDSLPYPARELINPKKYIFEKRPYTMLLTSRGCPHSCTFCSVQALAGFKHRQRSIDSILEEIEICIKDFGIEVFDFQDDNLLFNQERIKTLFELIIKKYEYKKFAWLASNGVNVSGLDSELLSLMKRMGFRKLDLALGTGNFPSRSFMKRPEKVEQYDDILNKANKLNLPVTTYIILGLPFQPLTEMKDTVKYLMNKNTLISPSIFYNVPGMPIYEEMLKYEYNRTNLARRSSSFNCFGNDFTRDDIFKLFLEIRNYNLKFK